MVAKLVARLDKALENLINSHVDLMIEMNVRVYEPMFTQYMDPLEDAAKEVKAMGEVAVPNCQLDGESLRQDYARMVWSIEDRIEECKAYVQ